MFTCKKNSSKTKEFVACGSCPL